MQKAPQKPPQQIIAEQDAIIAELEIQRNEALTSGAQKGALVRMLQQQAQAYGKKLTELEAELKKCKDEAEAAKKAVEAPAANGHASPIPDEAQAQA